MRGASRRNRLRTRKLTRMLGVEALEDRSLLAGNVTVTLQVDTTGSNLYITGDNAENRISVESIGAGNIQVRGFSDSKGVATSVNGSANALKVFNNVKNGVFIHTQGGNDLVRVTNVSIGGSLLVDLGAGNDEAVLGIDKTGGDARFGNTPSGPLHVNNVLNVNGAFGNDLLYASDAHMAGRAVVTMGDGNDTVRMNRPTGSGQNVEINQSALIQTGFGLDTVDITGLIVGFDCVIDDINGVTTVGKNTLNLSLNAVDAKQNLSIYTDDYDDSISIASTSVTNNLNITTGLGNNSIHFSGIAGTLVVQFDDGSDSLYLLNANIAAIDVEGFGGNDLFDVRNTTSTDATFDGGLGTDSFVTSVSQPNHFKKLTKLNIP